jgi:hypothetical protein
VGYRFLNLSTSCAIGALLLPWSGAVISVSSAATTVPSPSPVYNPFAPTLVVPVPCTNSIAAGGPPGVVATGSGSGLRLCNNVIYAPATAPTPGLLAVISNNVAASTNPTIPDHRGTIQKYADCYYKGYELDATGVANLTLTPTTNVCTLGNPTPVHNFCSIVPNFLNNNISEGSGLNGAIPPTGGTVPNAAGTSCGQFAKIYVSIQSNCPSTSVPNPATSLPVPTASEAAVLAQNNLTMQGLQNPNLSDQTLNALATQAGVTPQRVQAASSGQNVCVSYALSTPNPAVTPADPSWERTQLSGTYMLALASNSTEVLNELSCQQSLTINTTSGCYALAQEVQGLGSQLASISAQLGQAANIGDIDYCQASFGVSTATGPSSLPSSTANLTGNLRQSAQVLCSARAKLEAAFGQLAMCDIFSRSQNDYVSKTGTPQLQAQFLSTMTTYLDGGSTTPTTTHTGTCGSQCKNMKSIGSLQSCLQTCYAANVQNYFQTTLTSSSYWPQPTPVNTSCVAGGTPYVGN